MNKTSALESSEAVVLQQIYEDGDNSLSELARTLRLHKGKVQNIVDRLRRKHLVAIRKNCGEALITISTQGKRLIGSVWPESNALTPAI